jgi:serine/threonine protein kinase
MVAKSIQPFANLLRNYTFNTRLKYYLCDDDIEGSMSRIYILSDREDPNKVFVCKRVNRRNYNRHEWKLPNAIESNRVIKFVGVYHCDTKNCYYLITPYYNHRDLFTYVRTHKPWNEKTVRPLFKEMCMCIKDCHDNDIIHMDVKTENFLVRSHNTRSDTWDILLIDFGFARKANQTKLSETLGTAAYCAPEIMDKFVCSKKSDIFSLGMVLLYLLFPDSIDMREDENKKISSIVDEFSHFRKYSDLVKHLVRKLVAHNPDNRYTIDQILDHQWFTTV